MTPQPTADDLHAAVDRLSDRLRALPESTLRRGAAEAAFALARELADRARRLERPAPPPAEFPAAGIYAVGDQLAVAGHDLAEALRAAPEGPATGRELAAALELVRDHRC
ncbi:hypothetical protein [Streptomyces sp. 6N223]|uniref:hypothetical protein n=1 Tax=Streptomyces sp. 6N223 TaxID=3457412 RepID=UPI003FD35E95